jgi:hypothetical protein
MSNPNVDLPLLDGKPFPPFPLALPGELIIEVGELVRPASGYVFV